MYKLIIVFWAMVLINKLMAQVQLPDIKVQEEKSFSSEPIDETSSVQIIGQDQIKKYSHIKNILDALLGVQRESSGGIGGHSSVFVRGGSSKNVLILINGVEVNSEYQSSVNLENIDVKSIQQIEIYKGHVPFKYAAENLSGVINIITNRAQKNFIRYAWSDLNSNEYQLKLAGKNKKAWSLTLNFIESENNYQFLNDNGTIYNTNDDSEQRRKNNEFESKQAQLYIPFNFNKHHFDFDSTYIANEKNIPNNSNQNNLYSIYENNKYLMTLSHAFEWNRKQKISHKVYFKRHENIFDDSNNSLGLSSQKERVEEDTLHLRSHYSETLGPHLLNIVASYQHTDLERVDSLNSSKNGKARRQKLSFAVDDTWFYQDWISSFGIKLLNLKDNGLASGKAEDDKIYFIGLKKIIATHQLSVHFSHLISYPDLIEKVGNQGLINSNSSLDKESSNEAQFKYDYLTNLGSLDIRVNFNAYYKSIKDYIALTFNSQGIGQYENIGDGNIWGTETEFVVKKDAIEYKTSYDDIYSQNKSNISFINDNLLPGFYHTIWFNELSYTLKNMNFFFQYIEKKEKYFDRSNALKTPSEYIWNLGLIYIYSETEMKFKIENIFDKNRYDFNGFPNPGRIISLEAKYSF